MFGKLLCSSVSLSWFETLKIFEHSSSQFISHFLLFGMNITTRTPVPMLGTAISDGPAADTELCLAYVKLFVWICLFQDS